MGSESTGFDEMEIQSPRPVCMGGGFIGIIGLAGTWNCSEHETRRKTSPHHIIIHISPSPRRTATGKRHFQAYSKQVPKGFDFAAYCLIYRPAQKERRGEYREAKNYEEQRKETKSPENLMSQGSNSNQQMTGTYGNLPKLGASHYPYHYRHQHYSHSPLLGTLFEFHIF